MSPLRPSVLDPAGTAVRSGLAHLGYDNVDQVRIGKYVELTLEASDEASASQQLDRNLRPATGKPGD